MAVISCMICLVSNWFGWFSWDVGLHSVCKEYMSMDWSLDRIGGQTTNLRRFEVVGGTPAPMTKGKYLHGPNS